MSAAALDAAFARHLAASERQRRAEIHARVVALTAEGLSARAVSERLGLSRATVVRALREARGESHSIPSCLELP